MFSLCQNILSYCIHLVLDHSGLWWLKPKKAKLQKRKDYCIWLFSLNFQDLKKYLILCNLGDINDTYMSFLDIISIKVLFFASIKKTFLSWMPLCQILTLSPVLYLHKYTDLNVTCDYLLVYISMRYMSAIHVLISFNIMMSTSIHIATGVKI